MDLTDALVITVLGMGVVFIGLGLTALLIISFSWLDRRRGNRPQGGGERPAITTATGQAAKLSPQQIAVICTVLEAEHRLHHGEQGRLTISTGTANGNAAGSRRSV